MIRYLSIVGFTWVAVIWSGTASGQGVAPRPVGKRQVQPARRQQVPAGQSQRGQGIPSQTAVQPPNRQAGGALAPDWIPLSAEHQERLDQILRYWEWSTGKIQRYRCRFMRYEYGPTLHNYAQKPPAKTYAEGVIKFAAPDKGLFRVEKILLHQRSRAPGGQVKWEWVDQSEGYREHWICDGKSIFEFDYQSQELKQRLLPPDIQGQRITEGPLPFMFGAKAHQIKQRFWVRPFWPAGVKQEHWLELIPKTREDAGSFRKLQIVIKEEDFLPKGMILYYPNLEKTSYTFESRETNWSIAAQQWNPFLREFYEPKLPNRDWKKVVEPLRPQAPAAPPSGSRQAKRRPQTIQPR